MLGRYDARHGRPGGVTRSRRSRSLGSSTAVDDAAPDLEEDTCASALGTDPVRRAVHLGRGVWQRGRVRPVGAAVGRTAAAASEAPPSEAPRRPRRRPRLTCADLKIGVVTDVGTVNDKNFNQFSLRRRGGGRPPSARPSPLRSSSRPPRPTTPLTSQAFIDQGFNVIVAVGLQPDRRDGRRWPRPTRTSGSSASTTSPASTPRVISTDLATAGRHRHADAEVHRDQLRRGPGRLPGRHRRGSVSKSDIIGAVGGVARAARASLHPGLHRRRPVGQAGHQDQVCVARTPTSSRLRRPGRRATPSASSSSQNAGIDVVFQVAGLTGNGVIDAACAAGINAIGVDVDQYQSYAGLAAVHP